MKTKILAIFILLTGTTTFAQQNHIDAIYLKNGITVKGNVTDFNFPIKIETADSTVLIFSMNEIEKVIKDGKVFVFSTNDVEKIRKDDSIVTVYRHATISSYFGEQEIKTCVIKNVFGWNFGLGTVGIIRQFNNVPTFDAGVHYSHRFSPYFSADFVKLNFKYGRKSGVIGEVSNIYKFEFFGYDFAIGKFYEYVPERIVYTEYTIANLQYMTGVRGNTSAFYKCMSGYGAFRCGLGVLGGMVDYKDPNPPYDDEYDSFTGFGVCFELEVGINLTRNISVGYAYNYQYHESLPVNSNTFRLSFNLGQ